MKNILLFGDSNTYGFDADRLGRFPPEQRWGGMLAALLGQDYAVTEAGQLGRTSVFEDPEAPGMSGLDSIGHWLEKSAPLWRLIIMLGTNDIKERFHNTAAAAADGVLRLSEFAAESPCWLSKPQILIVAPPPVAPEYTELGMAQELGEGCFERSRQLPEELRRASAAAGFNFYDPGLLPLSRADGVHMSAAAHEKLASSLLTVLRELA